jgi:hypothetical protein
MSPVDVVCTLAVPPVKEVCDDCLLFLFFPIVMIGGGILQYRFSPAIYSRMASPSSGAPISDDLHSSGYTMPSRYAAIADKLVSEYDLPMPAAAYPAHQRKRKHNLGY